MELSYSYHSEQEAQKQDRWIHFSIFLVALLLILAAAQQFYLYFTAWTVAEESHNWSHLIFGSIYLIVAVLLAWLGWRLKNASRSILDRYVRIADGKLTWNLTQKEGEQTVMLADIKQVERPNVRELVLTLTSGTNSTIAVFLIAEEEKQEELIAALEEILRKNE